MYTLAREIEFKPSRRLGLLLAAMASLAVFAIARAALPLAFQIMLGTTVLLGLGWGLRKIAAQQSCLRVGSDGSVQCADDNGEWRSVEVLGDSFVSPRLIVLRYRIADGSVRVLTLLSDSASAEDLRRLRVALRWTRRTRSDTTFPDAG